MSSQFLYKPSLKTRDKSTPKYPDKTTNYHCTQKIYPYPNSHQHHLRTSMLLLPLNSNHLPNFQCLCRTVTPCKSSISSASYLYSLIGYHFQLLKVYPKAFSINRTQDHSLLLKPPISINPTLTPDIIFPSEFLSALVLHRISGRLLL